MRHSREDTIAALATAPGQAALAVVRLSGPAALAIAERVTGRRPRPRRAELCRFMAADGQPIDSGIVLFFPGPHSYTGEDVVEFHGHGGPVASDWLLETLYGCGARPAEPGEFTLRAFLHDKLDLAQAEAVADLIASRSRLGAAAALRSLSGRFSDRVNTLQAALTELRVEIEAWLDFPEEELDLSTAAALSRGLGDAIGQLDELIANAATGAALSDGLSIVIAGAPNAGKSSLLNALAGYDAAIVTDVPGTTRDTVRERLVLDGLPVDVVDTAGLRETDEAVEAEGVRRARRALGQADRILWIADIGLGLETARQQAAAALAASGLDTGVTIVLNKIDLHGEPAGSFASGQWPVLRISALHGDGIDLLIGHLRQLAGVAGDTGGSFSARRRHLDALGRAADGLREAEKRLDTALELAAEELRSAQAALSELTGELSSDDLLGEIFAGFCIGK